MRRPVGTICGAAALCAAAIVLVAGPERAQATFPGRIGPLVFSSTTSGGRDLLVANPVNGKTTRITSSPAADDDEPVWSGELGEPHIAFQSRRAGNLDIYVVDVDGSNEQRLTTGAAADTEPAWSPDEAEPRIAFVSDRDGNREIYSMAADGSDVRRLTDDGADDLDPAWSPDGRRIAFASRRGNDLNIWVMNADGTGRKQLTTWSGDELEPAWSRDNKHLAFVRKRPDANQVLHWDVFLMDADGTHKHWARSTPA